MKRMNEIGSADIHYQQKEQTSPMPMKARTNSKKGKPSFAAIGVRAVAMDHQTTPNPSTVLPPIVSAHIPPATCTQGSHSAIRNQHKTRLEKQK